ncbi:MAG TPA: amino acid permease [Thermoanaerobaculia bacterium]|jgi:APA family basic amino acid/polyamine antiporter|nr:amino acid permease [Thermoanaerobaculia bacterium]
MTNPLFARKPLSVLLEELKGENRLRRVLGPVQLTSLGVGAVIGAGIFVSTGAVARQTAGPALTLSYAVAGLVCVFAALCYAEFASMVPVAGSAYTYAYATLGELLAWIIGWDLILEYAVSSATVADGWSGYFQSVLNVFGWKLPHAIAGPVVNYDPQLGHVVATGSYINLPAVAIVVLVTGVLVIGIQESASVNTALVGIKVAAVLFVIGVGLSYVNRANWHPFAPFGLTGLQVFGHTLLGQSDAGGKPVGMLAGAALAFFAYIGFDSVSTHSEEARNPRRDVPIGIIVSLVLCTLLYICVVAVLTGMVPYDQLDVNAPVADAFRRVGLRWAQFLIALAGIAGITSVLLVTMLSQARILLAIARDGLLPAGFFAAVHDRFRTPWKSTIVTGIFVGSLAAFLPISVLLMLVNMGTLFAFVIVCAAVLIMRRTHPEAERPFRVPFVPVIPIVGIGSCLLLMFSLPSENWLRLIVWLAIGLIIYFSYGRKHSKLRRLRARGEESEAA